MSIVMQKRCFLRHHEVLLLLLIVISAVSSFTPTRRQVLLPSQMLRKQQQTITTCLAATSSSSSSSSLPDSTLEPSTASNQPQEDKTSNQPQQPQTVTTVTFPSYLDLMDLTPGQYVTSDDISVGTHHFRVKLYPRGGGHRSSTTVTGTTGMTQQSEEQSSGGFGMSYKILPLFGNKAEEKVGIYLEYLPAPNDSTAAAAGVDATFALRLKGNQIVGRKFDIEWRAGMRFVSLEKSNLAQGRAHDFGAHLMQTSILSEFLGIINSNDINDPQMDHPIKADIEITVHNNQENNDSKVQSIQKVVVDKDNITSSQFKDPETKSSLLGFLGQDIRIPTTTTTTTTATTIGTIHDPEQVRVGRIVVPVLNRLGQRPRMFELGAYPGVEYRILRIVDPQTGQDRFTSCPGATYDLKPIYPLVSELERPWPVTVSEQEIPKLLTPNMYNALSAAGSLFTAVTGLFLAFCLSQAVSLFFIPSRSMDPTLQVGDVLLVDKVTPRLLGKQQERQEGTVVLFSPPSALRDIVAANGGTLTSRDLFVKRIAASHEGDRISVTAAGQVSINNQPSIGKRDICEAEPLRLIEKYIKPKEEIVLDENEVFVLGDCSSVSIDSRVWGPLPSNDIVGKPILRLWPLDRFGSIGALPTTTTSSIAEIDPSTVSQSTSTTASSSISPTTIITSMDTTQWDD